MSAMRTINRSALIVRPKQPYLAWAGSLDAESPAAAEELRSQVSVYLVPQDPAGEDEAPPIEEFFEDIFTQELEAWSLDPGQWPRKRDLTTFTDWFEVTAESMVIDLGHEPLEVEEL